MNNKCKLLNTITSGKIEQLKLVLRWILNLDRTFSPVLREAERERREKTIKDRKKQIENNGQEKYICQVNIQETKTSCQFHVLEENSYMVFRTSSGFSWQRTVCEGTSQFQRSFHYNNEM